MTESETIVLIGATAHQDSQSCNLIGTSSRPKNTPLVFDVPIVGDDKSVIRKSRNGFSLATSAEGVCVRSSSNKEIRS
jgi:hypothetical protein